MIEVLRVKIMWVVFCDTLDALVSCERTLGEDIILTQEIIFLDQVMIVNPIKDSWIIESFPLCNLRNPYTLSNKMSCNDVSNYSIYFELRALSLH
jgi:hypothetical protein